MPQRHILWDFNGTLLDDVDLAVWCDNQVLAGIGMEPISRERYQREMRAPMADFYHALGVDMARLSYEEINAQFLRLFNENVDQATLRPGVLHALETLRGEGFTHSIVSASFEPTVRRQAGALGLTPYMRRITGLLDESAGHKKDRARWHLEQLALPPEAVTLVGDTLGDAELAAHLGCRCVLVTGGHTDAERLAGSGLPLARDEAALLALLREAD